MTEKLYDKDSHLKEFTGTVLSCEKTGENYTVTLDRTAFFPEGGGQQSDRGYIGEAYMMGLAVPTPAFMCPRDQISRTGLIFLRWGST